MQLIIEKEIDKHYYNLFTTLEMMTFITNEHEKDSCKDIMLAFKRNSELSISLKSISHTHNVYIFLHYILMFS